MTAPPTMSPDNPNEFDHPPNSSTKTMLFLLALAAIVGFVPWWVMRQAALGHGRRAPEIVAEGWMNGDAPTQGALAGKVVLLNVWASW